MLQELCKLYTQDFYLVFERTADPADLFCPQQDVHDPEQFLRQMEKFHQGILSGSKSIRGLVNMRLEYIPGTESTRGRRGSAAVPSSPRKRGRSAGSPLSRG